MNTYTVIVHYKTKGDMFEPIAPGDRYRQVITLHFEGEDTQTAAETSFAYLNMPTTEMDRMVLGIRSMSVGDVAEVHDEQGNIDYWLCESIGWRRLDSLPDDVHFERSNR